MKTHPLIRNAAKEIAEFDENRPFLFLDIDGVINSIPYERHWCGPEKDVTELDLALAKNWKWVKLSPDLSTDFPVTRTFTANFDNFADFNEEDVKFLSEAGRSSKPRYSDFTISLTEEMLDQLRTLIKKHNLQVVYLTYWKSEAIRTLEPEINLGGELYLDWNRSSNLGHINKVYSLLRFYEEANLRVPFAFLDDEAFRNFNFNSDLFKAPENASEIKKEEIAMLNAIPKLFIEPNPFWGINRQAISDLQMFFSKF